ncbi:MAG: PilZ domain-containing protein [Candidatus Adiutrix sp.]|jgi:c-di-GMP-binding flagellar brake protein YcgR|nr:PilZ domain-containing protein [Candidatus Adiutrix sp.]
MSTAPKKTARPVDPSRLLRVQNRLDLILSEDLVSGLADVRSSMILDLSDTAVTAAQTDPPILKSMTDRVIDASIVHHDLKTYEPSRWGWTCRILGQRNDYRLNPQDPDSFPVSVVFLSPPPPDGLTKANVRQAYRLDLSGKDIALTISPAESPVKLVNFSTGGVMLESRAPHEFRLGQALNYVITFPPTDDFAETTLRGEAVVVRMEYDQQQRAAKLGLKFREVNVTSSRDIQKIINYYMLEEQRKRNRGL